MLLQNRIERTIDQLRGRCSAPVRIELWNGRGFDLADNPSVVLRVNGPRAFGYLLSPSMDDLGKAFVEGHIDVEGPIDEVIRACIDLSRQGEGKPPRSALPRRESHSRETDRGAIEYHYDVSNDFYALFLDREMVYSCGYFRSPDDSLELAQQRKIDHILTKLRIAPGERLLDVGCGWGALIVRAASKYGAIATGITLSRLQHEWALERIRREGLQDHCFVELRDYRDVPGAGIYDKIASVGMFEHVGLANLPEYFGALNRLLRPRGLVLNHGITSGTVEEGDVICGGGAFIERYVFPNGELPHLSRTARDMSAAGLEVIDVESLRRHYALTCREWATRLEARKAHAAALAGERRSRSWRIYLAGCAFGFDQGWVNVHQLLACKSQGGEMGSQPLTRDYMYQGSRSSIE